MNVLVVLGSPRKNGNTNKLANEFIKGAKSSGHDVDVYSLNDMNFRGCQACEKCRDNNIDCIQNDDLTEYFDKLHKADVLLVTSPIYSGTVTGLVMTMINRHYSITEKNLETGKEVLGIFSQGVTDVKEYEPAINSFMAEFKYRGMDVIGYLVHTGKITADQHPQLMEDAFKMGSTL